LSGNLHGKRGAAAMPLFLFNIIPGTIICLAAHMHNHPLEPMPAAGEQL
jgi:hypothetical protein